MTVLKDEITIFLRDDYKSFRDLIAVCETELQEIPLPMLVELRHVLDHLAHATDVNNPGKEIQKAKAHLDRAARDAYVMLLSSRLDKISLLQKHLSSETDIKKFTDVYQRVSALIKANIAEYDKPKPVTEYWTAIGDIDALLKQYSDVLYQTEKNKILLNKKYYDILIAILSALIGVFASVLFNWFYAK